jgi:UDP-glucose 4-epimerase
MILVTGALGYIGSHICVELAATTKEPLLLVDNSCHETEHTIEHLNALTPKPCEFVQLDLLCDKQLGQLFKSHPDIHTVIHCAAKKNVFDSIKYPLDYYNHNLVGSYNLLKAMNNAKVKQLVFSSTAAVYADAGNVLYDENMPTAFNTAYGNSKLMFEQLIRDYCIADKHFSAIALRYFNVAGAHPSGLLGELLSHSSGNLFPAIFKVALGQVDHLDINGSDYPTIDGTAVRDYIHVMDVARGHIDAIDFLDKHTGFEVFNLGRGQGNSVLQVVNAFQKITHATIPYELKPRRPGDLCAVVANANKAKMMGWTAHYGIEKMIEDAWRYNQTMLNNPNQ